MAILKETGIRKKGGRGAGRVCSPRLVYKQPARYSLRRVTSLCIRCVWSQLQAADPLIRLIAKQPQISAFHVGHAVFFSFFSPRAAFPARINPWRKIETGELGPAFSSNREGDELGIEGILMEIWQRDLRQTYGGRKNNDLVFCCDPFLAAPLLNIFLSKSRNASFVQSTKKVVTS